MNRTKYIIRIIFVFLTVFLLVYLNRKTDDNSESIAEFKLKMIEKIRTDSLESKDKLELLLKETTEYIDDSSHVRDGIHYLMRLLGLWVIIELVFLVVDKRNYGRQEIK
jgi:hypothetical protein